MSAKGEQDAAETRLDEKMDVGTYHQLIDEYKKARATGNKAEIDKYSNAAAKARLGNILDKRIDGLQSSFIPKSYLKASKRTNQVKVLLSEDELTWLDEKVASNDSDRASEIRNLLHQRMDGEYEMYLEEMKNEEKTTDNLLAKSGSTSIRVVTPISFEEVPHCINLLKEGTLVNLNLTMLEPDVAQRSVDFVAGGAFALEGHQERVGESIFLFAPYNVDVGHTGEIDENDLNFRESVSLNSSAIPALLAGSKIEKMPATKGEAPQVKTNKEKAIEVNKVGE